MALQYPTGYNSTYIVATSEDFTAKPWMAFDPALSLVGPSNTDSWLSGVQAVDQKLNADYGTPFVLESLVINNMHWSGLSTDNGIKNVTVYGTDSAVAFANVTYADLTDLTALHTFVVLEHVALDQADPQEVIIPGTPAEYRYYVFRIADGYGGTSIGVRRIQAYGAPIPEPASINGSLGLTGAVNVSQKVDLQGALGLYGTSDAKFVNNTIVGYLGLSGSMSGDINISSSINGALVLSGVVSAISANQNMSISGSLGLYGFLETPHANCPLPIYTSSRWT